MTDDDLAGSLRFGVNLGRLVGAADPGPVPAARQAEASGFDIVTVADHVGSSSPFVLLAAAAVVTTRVRLRTYVLDHGLWNPGLLAREVATLDLLSGGRVDLGLGVGYLPGEHEAVGVPFPPYPQRLADLDAFATRVRALLDDPAFTPTPVQRPVPLFVAAMSQAGVALAARHGPPVALSGTLRVPGRPAGTLALASAAQTDQRVAQIRAVRAGLGEPGHPPLDVLLQQVVVDRDPVQVAAQWARDGLQTAAEVLDSPFVLFAATVAEAADELLRRARRWGITSWCTHPPSGPALAEVIAALRVSRS